MENKQKRIAMAIIKTVIHVIIIYGMIVFVFLAFALGPYDDHYIGQKIISQYRLGFCETACFFGVMINAVIAWVSFKKTKVFSIIYMILGTICLARLVWLLTL